MYIQSRYIGHRTGAILHQNWGISVILFNHLMDEISTVVRDKDKFASGLPEYAVISIFYCITK